jgi:hypothetical protein
VSPVSHHTVVAFLEDGYVVRVRDGDVKQDIYVFITPSHEAGLQLSRKQVHSSTMLPTGDVLFQSKGSSTVYCAPFDDTSDDESSDEVPMLAFAAMPGSALSLPLQRAAQTAAIVASEQLHSHSKHIRWHDERTLPPVRCYSGVCRTGRFMSARAHSPVHRFCAHVQMLFQL